MKKIVQILAVSLILFSCNGSKTGKWSAEDRSAFFKAIEDSKIGDKLGEEKEAWLTCYYNKIENNFSSFREADNNEAKVMEFALSCNVEVYSAGSVKGKWSESSKNKFYNLLEAEDFSSLGEKKQKYFDCYFEKLQAKYPSVIEADKEQAECEKLATACALEIGL